jgi:hypothetical protein
MKRYRKFITALITAALTCAAIFLTPEQYPAARDLIAALVSFLGALGVYVVKNEEPR